MSSQAHSFPSQTPVGPDRSTRGAAHGEAATAGEREDGSRRRSVGRRGASYAARSPVVPLPSTLDFPPPVWCLKRADVVMQLGLGSDDIKGCAKSKRDDRE
ncbi:uncharacterized protein [Triticum aestivum]|uniref:uncharacterized protein n=1 Tax=Triticum aestivum TaxID=4565 RepID=UPI001D03226D|nr:uncharacterized protein LOC123164827 [Triticum aestivum]